MESDELRDFLVQEGVPLVVAQSLHNQHINGKMFVMFAGDADKLRELAKREELENELTSAVIMYLMELKSKVTAKNEEIGPYNDAACAAGGTIRRRNLPKQATTTDDISESSITSSTVHLARTGPITAQVERLFLSPSDNSKGYTWGNYIKNEAGPNTLEPCREFKRLDLSSFVNIVDAKDAFLERVYEFSIGCMNARLNGTLYIGLENSCHGDIRGHFLTPDENNKLQEMLEVHLTRTDATLLQGLPEDEIDAIGTSIKALQFVPVNKGVPKEKLEKAPPGSNLFVIELDVEPASAWCGDMKFKLPANVVRDGAKGKKKKDRKDAGKQMEFIYFFRDGSQTISFVESNKADMKRIEKAIVARKHNEDMAKASVMDRDTEKRLANLLSLKRSSGFPHETIRYVLIHNDLEVSDSNSIEWIASMDWFLILDFSEEKKSEPLKSLNEASMRPIPQIDVEELAQQENDTHKINAYVLSAYGASPTLHVNCVPKADGEDNWQKTGGVGLTKLISVASNFDEDLMSDVVVIVLLGSHTRLQFVAETMKEFQKVLPSISHIVCMYKSLNDAHMIQQQVEPFFGNQWREQTFCINFPQLNNYLLNLMGQEKKSEHSLPCSFVIGKIPQKSLDIFSKSGVT